MKFSVYVLHNNSNGKIYIGYTADIEKRLARHNKKLPTKKQSFTSKQKGNGEWKIVYSEKYLTRSQAQQREKKLKTSRGRSFLKETLNKSLTVNPSADGLLSS